MELNAKNFNLFIDELLRCKHELNILNKSYGQIEIADDHKLYVFIDSVTFNDFSLTYWGIYPKLEGDFLTSTHRYFTWINNSMAFSTRDFTKALTERVEQISDTMSALDNCFDNTQIEYRIGAKAIVALKVEDKEKAKKLLNVNEYQFTWFSKNLNDYVTVYII